MRSRDSAGSLALAVVLGLAVAAATVLIAVPALGEPAAPERAPMVREGVEGIWVRLDVARGILADLGELAIRRRELALIDEQLRLRDQQTERLRQMVGLEQQASAAAVEGLRLERERADQATREAAQAAASAEAMARAWWRSPALWVGVGVLVAIAIEAAAVAVLAELR